MNVDQDAFRAALLDPSLVAPEGLTDGQGRPAGRRFDVYRNNVSVALADALETAFPAPVSVITIFNEAALPLLYFLCILSTRF